MKRRWFGVFLSLFASISFVMSAAPVAQASSAGCSDPTRCVLLVVRLSNPNIATVTAQRQGTDHGIADYSFTLDTAGITQYSSTNTVGATAFDTYPCLNPNVVPDASNPAMFTITVTDNATHQVIATKTNQKLCSDPTATTTTIRTIDITTPPPGHQNPNGGISGTIQVKDSLGTWEPCSDATQVNIINNATNATTNVNVGGGNGTFATSISALVPGTYTVNMVCKDKFGQGYQLQRNNVVVKAGVMTAIRIDQQNPSDTFTGPGTPPPSPSPPTADTTNCDAGPGFTWIICGVIKLLVGDNGIVSIIRDNIIVPFLKAPPLSAQDDAGHDVPAYQIWTAFRNVASVFFILVFFLIIIGTAAGFDNYTIKKVLPHLVAGAILVPFSWYICAFVVDIGNVLGQGMVALVSPIIGTPTIDLTSDWASVFGIGTATVLGGFVLYGAAATVGLGSVITLLLGFLAVFLTLILRQIVLTLLIVLSPFALLAWVLPNTEKWFKTWWQDFFKLVMMYPIIMLLFEAGRLFAKTVEATTPQGGAPGTAANFVRPVIQIAALMLPLFAVPFAFKFAGKGLGMAGGAVGKFTGAADSKFGKNSDSAKQAAQNRERKNLDRARQLSDAAGKSSGLKAFGLRAAERVTRRRSGFTKPLRTKGIGSNGAAELEHEAAYSKAMANEGILGANRKNSAEKIASEGAVERKQAEILMAQNKKISDRASRMGLVAQANEKGAAAEASDNREIYAAGVEASKRQAATRAGDARGMNQATITMPQSSQMVSEYAMEHGEAKGFTDRGEVVGSITAGHNLDHIAEEAENAARIASGRPTINIAQAHTLRMQNLARSAGLNAGKKALQTEVDVNSSTRSDDDLNAAEILRSGGTISTAVAARNRMRANLAASSSEARANSIAQEGKARAYNEVEHAAGGPMSTADILDSERLLQRQGIVDARQKRTGALDTVGSSPSTARMLAASRSAAGKSFAAQESNVEGTERAMAAEAALDGSVVGTNAAFAAAAGRSYSAGASTKARQLAKSAAQEEGIIQSENKDFTRQRAIARLAGTPAPTIDDARAMRLSNLSRSNVTASLRATTSEFAQDQAAIYDERINPLSAGQVYRAALTSAGKDIGAKTGTIQATLDAGDAEARLDKQAAGSIGASEASIRRASSARRVEVGAQLSQTVGKTQGMIDADSAAHVTGESYISDSRTKTSRALAGESGDVRGRANELNDEINAQMATNNPLGVPAKGTPAHTAARDQAAAQVRDRRMAAANVTGRTKGERDANKQTNVDRGIESDINNKVEDGVYEERANSLITASRHAAAVGAGAVLTKEQALAQAKKAGAPSAAESAAAQTRVRQRDLKALGSIAAQDASFASRKETMEATGEQLALDTQAENEANKVLNTEIDKVQSAARAAGAALPHELAKQRAQAALGISRAESLKAAAETVKKSNLGTIGEAARITGQESQIEKVQKAEGEIETNAAAVQRAPVEVARNAAYKAMYEETYNATHAATKISAKQDALAKGNTNEQAESIAETEAKLAAETAAQTAAGAAAESARLDTLQKVKNGEIGPEEQERAAITAAGVAAREQAIRSAASKDAITTAVNQSVAAPGSLSASDRVAVATETAVASEAAKLGEEKARAELTSAGQSLNQPFQVAQSDADREARKKLLLDRTVKAGNQNITVKDSHTGDVSTDKINGIDLGGGKYRDLEQQARELLGATPIVDTAGNPVIDPETGRQKYDLTSPPKDEARAAAIMWQLSLTNGGRDRIRGIQKDLFGRTRSQTINPKALGGRSREVWEIVQTKLNPNVRDFFMPEDAAYDGIGPAGVVQLGWSGQQDYFKYVSDQGSAEVEALRATARENARQDAEITGADPDSVDELVRDAEANVKIPESNKFYDESTRNLAKMVTNEQVAKDIDSDSYAQMFIFMQDPRAREQLLKQDKGKAALKTILRAGTRAEAYKKLGPIDPKNNKPTGIPIGTDDFTKWAASNDIFPEDKQ